MRFPITKDKLIDYGKKYNTTKDDKDFNIFKATTKVALIENKKPRQAHKLDSILNESMPKEKQFTTCVEFASKIFEDIREILIK